MPDAYNRPPLSQTTGHNLSHSSSRPNLSHKRSETFESTRSADSNHLAPARVNALGRKTSNISDAGSAPDSLLDLYGTGKNGISNENFGMQKAVVANGEEEDAERWIHRDKLAQIESQELQAAGIVLPRARAASKSSRRERSRDQQGNGIRSEHAGQKRQRIESFPTEEEQENNDWDLRTPEEAAETEEGFYRDVSGGMKGISRIPLSTSSPIPIPIAHLERDTPLRRSQAGSWTGDDAALSYPKTRRGSINILEDATVTPTPATRPAADSSPTKKASRRTSTSTPGSRAVSGQRPKTKSGPSPRETSGQRPNTRSGELNKTKRPEGEAPWMSTMFKPDPRLPPDQQLLPTVAKRLQQEQWEKEGKFGTAYDTAFRPLNDEEYQQPPDPEIVSPPTPKVAEQKLEVDHGSEWPLRGPKSPALSTGRPGTSGGYSTIPKIQGKPQGVEPLYPPKPEVVRTQEPPEDAKKGGCGCCVVM